MKGRWRSPVVVTLGALATAGVIFACSLHDTSYLQSGPEPTPEDGLAEVITPETGGADGGATRTATVIAPNQLVPRFLAQDTDTLYWATNDGALFALKKDGSEPTPRLVATIGQGTTSLFAEQGSGTALFYTQAAKIFTVPKAGGAPSTVGTTTPNPSALAVDGTFVFVMADDGTNTEEVAGLYRFVRDGSQPTILRRSDSTFLYGIALQGNDVFWDEGDSTFRSLPKDAVADAGPTTYEATAAGVESATGPLAFAVDDTSIYYSDQQVVRTVARVAKSAPSTLVTSSDDAPDIEAIAIDDKYVYAIDSVAKGTLQRNTKDGRGTPELMLEGLLKPNAIVVDATTVYITVEGPPGAVVKCPK